MSAPTEGFPVPAPSIGRIVHYRLSEYDAEAINRRRLGFPNDFNAAVAGQAYPALVVRTFGGQAANLQVFLDGNDTQWVTSRTPGEDNGQWCWPARV
ncbi:MAG: hypothetical protein QOF58_2322 [Pseudonocardiales bacterium]|jgi:hypothetical protein|nr:hypothetical protein [Pseudonocardiales bacterium]